MDGYMLRRRKSGSSGKPMFKELNMEGKIEIEGLDLTDHFIEENSPAKLIANSINNWMPDKKYDLITCVHGLHYIGDKLAVIEKSYPDIKTGWGIYCQYRFG